MNELKFQRAYDVITSHGWLTQEEAKFLIDTAEKTSGDIVEVGCYMGRSAMLLAHLGRPLHCIDPWDNNFSSDYTGDEIFKRFNENILSLGALGFLVKPYRMRVEDWPPVPAGFVYLDGDHTRAGTEAQISTAFLCGSDYIAIHDIADGGDGLVIKQVATEMLGHDFELVGRLGVWRVNYGHKLVD